VETPDQALQTVKRIVASAQGEKFTVVGITGPGEPLANNATFETLRMVKKHFPRMILCLKTNGLLLPEKLEELTDIGVSHITVTINTLDELVGTRIYSYIRWKGKTLFGPEASWILIDKQLAGLELAAKAGMTLKVNTVLIPGVNDNLLYDLCLEIKKRGAHIHNILPLIPQGKLSHIKAPTKDLITSIRSYIGEMLPQI
jgi:nitrogen fixation protein NifB